MTKRKYCKGDLVVNIAELSNYHGFLYLGNKIWHYAWWSKLQGRIKAKQVWFAEKIGGEK